MDTRYIITAINKLTGIRERVSSVYPDKNKAVAARLKMMRPPTEDRAYMKPRVEAYQPSLF